MSALNCYYCGKQLSGDCKCGCVGEKHAAEMDRLAESAKSWEEDAKLYANNVGHWRGKYEELVGHHNRTVAELMEQLQKSRNYIAALTAAANEKLEALSERLDAAKQGEVDLGHGAHKVEAEAAKRIAALEAALREIIDGYGVADIVGIARKALAGAARP